MVNAAIGRIPDSSGAHLVGRLEWFNTGFSAEVSGFVSSQEGRTISLHLRDGGSLFTVLGAIDDEPINAVTLEPGEGLILFLDQSRRRRCFDVISMAIMRGLP